VSLSKLNDFTTSAFQNNTASYFGGAIGFSMAVQDSGSAIDLKALSSFQNNAAMYGKDIGGLWAKFNASFVQSAYITDSLVMRFDFADIFDQEAVGVECTISQTINWSLPNGVFTKVDIEHIQQRSTGIQSERFTLMWFPVDLNDSLPFPNYTISFVGVMDLNSAKKQLSIPFNFSRQLCPPGAEFINEGSYIYACRNCRAGTFVAYGESAYCAECPIGKYSLSVSTFCSDCPPGHTANLVASSTCIPCLPGSFNAESGGTCSLCPKNQYSHQFNSTSCQDCTGGSIAINDGSASVYSCVCKSGFYGQVWNDQICQKCSDSVGISCDLNSSIPGVSPGFWRDPETAGRIYQCIPLLSCLSTDLNYTTTCAIGYQGKRCGECQFPGFFHFDNLCKKCGDWKISASAFALFLALCLLFLLNGISSRRNLNTMDLHAILYSVQIVALYPRLSQTWPPVVKSCLDSLSVFVRSLKSLKPVTHHMCH
jgi:hypothetical protein